MCGRFTHLYSWRELHRLMRLTSQEFDLPPSYNVAPTQVSPVVIQREGDRSCTLLKWGLIPFWAKDPSIGNRTINARAEGISEKPAFREAVRRRRCVVPVSGFYEWKKEGAVKRPYYITAPDLPILPLAGLWERWKDPQGEEVRTFTIITTAPTEFISSLHDRMPAILEPADIDAWLAETTRQDAALAMLKPFDAAPLAARSVSTRVNSPANNDSGLLEA